jgi:hypothetical protein
MEARQREESLKNSTKYDRDREEFYRKLAKWRSGPKEKVYASIFSIHYAALRADKSLHAALYVTGAMAVVCWMLSYSSSDGAGGWTQRIPAVVPPSN